MIKETESVALTLETKLRAMSDSVDVISRVLKANVYDEESKRSVQRNIQHLERMLSKSEVYSAPVPLATYLAGAVAGRLWLSRKPA